MRVFKHGRHYWYEFTFDGKRFRATTKEGNRRKAEGIAAKVRSDLAEGRVGLSVRPPAPFFEAAMKAFLAWSEVEHQTHPRTTLRYKTSSKPLLAFVKFRGKRLDKISPADVEEYKVYRSRMISKRTEKSDNPQ